MNTLLFLLAIAGLISQSHSFLGLEKIYREPPTEPDYRSIGDVSEHYITQKLDNFNPTDNRTFQMRYLKNQRYFKSGGPIFIFVGGEWVITPGAILPKQHITDLAKEFNGILYYTEHRYYGKTHPTNSTSVQNLRYLTVDQALADLAIFIETMKSDEKLNATGGVILVGGSYSATMVTWFRQKYPHLVNGAWSSSAPLRAKLNFYEYKEAVGVSLLKVGGEKCYNKIEQVFKRLDHLVKSGEFEYLRKRLNLCDDFDGKDKHDVWYFHAATSNVFSGVVQYHRPGDIESVCRGVSRENPDESNDLLYGFAQLFRQATHSPGSQCVSMNSIKRVENLMDDSWNSAPSNSSMRQWLYQTCSEFGWYQTCDSDKAPFGRNFLVDFYTRFCSKLYGESFNNATLNSYIHQSNVFYGALKPEVTNVFSTHGDLDPWHRMGVLSDINSLSPTVIIPGASHCNDLRSIDYEKDSKEMINAKLTITKLVTNWLSL